MATWEDSEMSEYSSESEKDCALMASMADAENTADINAKDEFKKFLEADNENLLGHFSELHTLQEIIKEKTEIITKLEMPSARHGPNTFGSSFILDGFNFRIVFSPVKKRSTQMAPTA